MHKPKEKVEILLRTCPDLVKIKSGGCSAKGIHKKKTFINLYHNMLLLKQKLGNKAFVKYEELLMNKLPWPCLKPEKALIIRLEE